MRAVGPHARAPRGLKWKSLGPGQTEACAELHDHVEGRFQ